MLASKPEQATIVGLDPYKGYCFVVGNAPSSGNLTEPDVAKSSINGFYETVDSPPICIRGAKPPGLSTSLAARLAPRSVVISRQATSLMLRGNDPADKPLLADEALLVKWAGQWHYFDPACLTGGMFCSQDERSGQFQAEITGLNPSKGYCLTLATGLDSSYHVAAAAPNCVPMFHAVK